MGPFSEGMGLYCLPLRRGQRAQRKVALVLFNFPPNAGNTGTAAFLAVFESLFGEPLVTVPVAEQNLVTQPITAIVDTVGILGGL